MNATGPEAGVGDIRSQSYGDAGLKSAARTRERPDTYRILPHKELDMDVDQIIAGTRSPPRAPAGLRRRGGAGRLWRGLLSEYLLRADEQAILGLVVRTVDEVERMRDELTSAPALTLTGARGALAAHPLVDAIERHEITALKLLAYLRASLDAADASGDAASRAGTALVNRRWARRRGG
jgi:hypothetical protein